MADELRELANKIDHLANAFATKEALEVERRKTDDARHEGLINAIDKTNKGVEALTERTDKHGLRTTALETQWRAFFSDEGAFKHVITGLEKQGGKVDKLSWFMAIGIGILAALQFAIPIIMKSKQ